MIVIVNRRLTSLTGAPISCSCTVFLWGSSSPNLRSSDIQVRRNIMRDRLGLYNRSGSLLIFLLFLAVVFVELCSWRPTLI